jgi:hypothetical protein
MKIFPDKIFEITWMVVSLLALFAGIHKTYFQGFDKSYGFFIIFLLSFIIYLFRRNKRKSG